MEADSIARALIVVLLSIGSLSNSLSIIALHRRITDLEATIATATGSGPAPGRQYSAPAQPQSPMDGPGLAKELQREVSSAKAARLR